jgi:hypothetical protein
MIEAQEPACGVNQDPDRVETQITSVDRRRAARKPGSRETSQACSLSGSQPFERYRRVAASRAHSPRLHLHEREHDAIERDQVDLARARACVAIHDRKAVTFEVPGGEVFAQAAKSAARIGACRHALACLSMWFSCADGPKHPQRLG